jgi:hypothetical protein
MDLARPYLTKCLPQLDQAIEVTAALCWWLGTALTKHCAVLVSYILMTGALVPATR